MPRTLYYQLVAVDNVPLPVTVRYRDQPCVVTGGSVSVHDEVTDFGDGRIEWAVTGRVERLPSSGKDGNQLFWWGEEFDRLDGRHLTFPGGWRKKGLSGAYVLTQDDVGMEIAPIGTDEEPPAQELFGARIWRFATATAAAESGEGTAA